MRGAILGAGHPVARLVEGGKGSSPARYGAAAGG